MITWTLTTATAEVPAAITAAGAELRRPDAAAAASDALRSALMDARALIDTNGTGPAYRITLDGEPAFTLGTGGTRSGHLDLESALDSIEQFEAAHHGHILRR